MSSSVPEPVNAATTEDSVSTTEAAPSTTLDTSNSVPDQGKQTTHTKPAPAGQPFQPIDPKYDFSLQSFSSGKKQKRFNRDWFKNEDGNLGYTTMQKKMQHYNTEKGAAFCSTCINATRMKLITSKNADRGFISNVMRSFW